MSWLSRVVNVYRSDRVSREIDEELQFHLDSRIEDLVRAGISPEAAEREARRRLGHPLLLRDRSRDIKLLPWLESLLQDARLGLRMLVKHRVVTGAALVSLSLALGASIGAFSVVDALVLRPLPAVGAPEELIYLTFRNQDPNGQEVSSFNYPLFLQLSRAALPWAQLFAVGFRWMRRAIVDGRAGTEERLSVQRISGSAFDTTRTRRRGSSARHCDPPAGRRLGEPVRLAALARLGLGRRYPHPRMALGAATRRVVRLALGEVTVATAIGLASGAAVGGALIPPARRATRVDPVAALRYE